MSSDMATDAEVVRNYDEEAYTPEPPSYDEAFPALKMGAVETPNSFPGAAESWSTKLSVRSSKQTQVMITDSWEYKRTDSWEYMGIWKNWLLKIQMYMYKETDSWEYKGVLSLKRNVTMLRWIKAMFLFLIAKIVTGYWFLGI